MTRSRFSQTTNSLSKNSSGAILVVKLAILAFTITILAAIFVQNLQPVVQIFFFGQQTLPTPLSVAMLVAFGVGVLIAFVFNAIATWRQNLLIRRAVVAAGYSKEPKEQVRAKKFQSKEEFVEDDYKDKKYDEQEEYDEEEYDDEEEEEEYEDDDPDTVPYGDRLNLKSKKNNQVKRDRPPLDAKYID